MNLMDLLEEAGGGNSVSTLSSSELVALTPVTSWKRSLRH
jgi:hypothetical protein